MLIEKYRTIEEVWDGIKKGKTIYWNNDGYQLTIEPYHEGNSEFTRQGDKVLRITYIENYFGSLLEEKELGNLYSKV